MSKTAVSQSTSPAPGAETPPIEAERAKPPTPASTPEGQTVDPAPAEQSDVTQEPEAPERPGTQSGNAEAAKYRRKLRDVEAERDELARTVDALRQSVAETMATRLAKPSALWGAGVKVADLLDGDGSISAEKVDEAVNWAMREAGLAPRPTMPRPDPSQGGGVNIGGRDMWKAALHARR